FEGCVVLANVMLDGAQIPKAAGSRDLVEVGHRERRLVTFARAIHFTRLMMQHSEIGPDGNTKTGIAFSELQRLLEIVTRLRLRATQSNRVTAGAVAMSSKDR